jgi:glycosyltransferase involved in cell wall biosynthesis
MGAGIPDVDAAPSVLNVLVDGASASTGGGETFLLSQLTALARRPDIRLTVYARGSVARALAARDLPIAIRRAPSLPLLLRLLWEQILLPFRASAFDVVYMPGNFALFISRRPQVVTFQNPNHFGSTARRVRRRLFDRRSRFRFSVEGFAARMSVRRATIPVAISRSLSNAIEEDIGEVSGLKVIYSAMPEAPVPREPALPVGRYVLALANDYPHKDWNGLIDAFASRPDLPPLRIVGRCRSIRRRAQIEKRLRDENLTDRIELMGIIRDRQIIHSVYSQALCLVAHSHLEAFPLTPYEAMSHHLPVVASDIPSHREVCGDYALYYPPSRPDLLADSVSLTLSDRTRARERPDLAARTWSDHAEEFAEVLLAAARQGRDRRGMTT